MTLAAPGRPGTRLPTAVGELALLLVHLAAVAGFARLYEDSSFVGPLAAFVLAATALAVLARRNDLPAPAVTALALVGAVLASTWILFPATTRYGLPTSETLDAARSALQLSRSRFRTVAAPAPVIDGFQLASGLALWCSVWFADWAAFRLRATVEAVAPPTVIFVFGALLGSGDHQVVTAFAFTAAVLLFVASHRALRAQLDEAWLTTSPVTGPRAVLRAGVSIAAVALLGGAIVGPQLPGADADAIVRFRAGEAGGNDRTTVSPIVDLRKRLVNQSDTELFTVNASRRAYWRLTSLDRFDGRLWTSGGEFGAAEGGLPSNQPPVADSRRNRQTITIRALSAIWAPVAFEAQSIQQSSDGLRWDPDSSTLIVAGGGGDEATSDGLQYTVVSRSPTLEPDQLRAAGADDGAAVTRRYESLPSGFPEVAVRTAARATDGAATRYDQALALQAYFREQFTYSLEVEPGNGDDALVAFLDSKRGYCEQFAGAYAAMARSLGIPSRVAVGFTPGQADSRHADDGDPVSYTVRGRHAHAWPELWFPGIGWVPFEPTPGRGIPGAQSYTDVPEQQDNSPSTITVQPSSTTTTTGASGPTSTAPRAGGPETTVPRTAVATGAGLDGPSDGPGRPTQILVGLIALALAWLASVLVWPLVRARRHRAAGGAAAAVLEAWHEALAPVRWTTGLGPRPAETHDEFARRAAPALGHLAPPFTELAGLATRAAWAPDGAGPADAERAGELTADLGQQARDGQGRWSRIVHRLSWREAFDRPRGVRPGQTSPAEGPSTSLLRWVRPFSRSEVEPR